MLKTELEKRLSRAIKERDVLGEANIALATENESFRAILEAISLSATAICMKGPAK
jgi:hypothetical protein